jgi:hypothetical protein
VRDSNTFGATFAQAEYMTPICIFVGPTLSVEDARAVLNAVYLPPVASGDLDDAIRRYDPQIIGIIDGVVEPAPAVRHREILYALSEGVHVFGASGVGALRAAELHAFGMIGVGRIFEDYLSGRTEEHSEAMVDIRYALELAHDRGVITMPSALYIEALAKQLSSSERSWSRVFAEARHAGVPVAQLSALKRWITVEKPNLKREDALQLLDRMRELLSAPLAPHVPSFELASTVVGRKMAAAG